MDIVNLNYQKSYPNSETPNKWNSNTETKGISRNSLGHVGSEKALVATAQQSLQRQRYYNQCRYCDVPRVMSVPISDRSKKENKNGKVAVTDA